MTRRLITIALNMIVCLLMNPSATFAANEINALDVGNRRQVFIDGRFLESAQGVALKPHRPRKTGEMSIVQDRPWEKRRVGAYVSVLRTDNVYHMWYDSFPDEDHWYLAYARSEDGVKWEKPNLGLGEAAGTKDNNIVAGHGIGEMDGMVGAASVFLDPTAPSNERFRMARSAHHPNRRIDIFSSPDGIHWSLTARGALLPGPDQFLDSQNVIFWDDRIGKYVAYIRKSVHAHDKEGVTWNVSRAVARSVSETLDRFPTDADSPPVLWPEDPDLFTPRRFADYYTNATVKYPWAEDAYYMFPSIYLHYARDLRAFGENTPRNAGVVDGRFAAGRDGVHWERYDRRACVPLGMKGDFDSRSVYMARGMVLSPDGRELYMYYAGSDRLHGWNYGGNNPALTKAGLAPERDVSAISRLVIRRDGFVSVRGSYEGGSFTTPVVTFRGARLILNVDASATGAIEVGILDAISGEPIEGFSNADCDRIHTANEIDRAVSWRGRGDLSEFAGRPVRLRFAIRDADLYAFQFAKNE